VSGLQLIRTDTQRCGQIVLELRYMLGEDCSYHISALSEGLSRILHAAKSYVSSGVSRGSTALAGIWAAQLRNQPCVFLQHHYLCDMNPHPALLCDFSTFEQ
jgi:hypothetical protein